MPIYLAVLQLTVDVTRSHLVWHAARWRRKNVVRSAATAVPTSTYGSAGASVSAGANSGALALALPFEEEQRAFALEV